MTIKKEKLGEGSIGAILKLLTNNLAHSSDAPALDAERILLHVFNQCDASYLIAHSEDILTKDQVAEVTSMQDKRTTGMPLAYILGEADFYGRTFTVTPDVLIPRPDTEALIDTALEYIKTNFSNKKDITIADMCTGSGIIAITLALKLYNLQPTTYRLIATDISEKALNIAKQNAEKHGVLDQIEFIQGDMFTSLQGIPVDLIVSNPPYVPRSEVSEAGTTKETRGLLFEPKIALDGGEDGLKFVNQIKEYSLANNIPAIIETVGGKIIQRY